MQVFLTLFSPIAPDHLTSLARLLTIPCAGSMGHTHPSVRRAVAIRSRQIFTFVQGKRDLEKRLKLEQSEVRL